MDTPHVFIRDVLTPEHHRPVAAPPRHRLPATILALSLVVLHPIATALRAQVTYLTQAPVPSPDAAVATAVFAIGLLAALWYALTGLGLLLSQLVRRDLGVSRWGAPLARRLALGAGIGLLAIGPAQADTPDDVSWGAVAALHEARVPPLVTAPASPVPPLTSATPLPSAGLPTRASLPESSSPPGNASLPFGATPPGNAPRNATAPGDATAPVRPGTISVAGPAGEGGEAPPSADATTRVVAPGDCLWSIAAGEFDSPSAATIATRVTDWIEANPGLAANPDLIHPGDVLVVPAGADR